tara:strand:+ start:8038 stop:8307 length:270 start_codon:yes stop_codon:yes gene_type:complete
MTKRYQVGDLIGYGRKTLRPHGRFYPKNFKEARQLFLILDILEDDPAHYLIATLWFFQALPPSAKERRLYSVYKEDISCIEGNVCRKLA